MTNPLPHNPADARKHFPGVSNGIYLETSARGLLPSAARAAAMAFYDDAVSGVPKETSPVFDAVERVREKFARLIGAAADEVTLTRNVTEGLNMMVASLDWKAGDNAIVCSDIEHPNGVYALYNMRDRHGSDVRLVNATTDYAMPVDVIEKRIDPRTRMVIASSVTFATGARTSLARLGEFCRRQGVILLVDGAQSVGALDLPVYAAHVDALAVGASKYLCGPYGLGFLFIRRELAETMRPAYLGRYSVNLGDVHEGVLGEAQYRLMPGARRFDLGSHNYAAANAVDASLDIIGAVTVPVIEKHVMNLSRKLDAGLRAAGLPMVSGSVANHQSHLVIVGAWRPTAEARQLMGELSAHYAARGIRVSERMGRLRFSFHLYNTADEVDAVIAATREWKNLPQLTNVAS